jgi:hypothetical protein
VTPRQACPRPEGLGRNLRSKTRWFAGFCNSHQVSHFATFFIDGRAEISVAESHLVLILVGRGGARHAGAPRFRLFVFLGAMSRRGSSVPPVVPYPPERAGRGTPGEGRRDGRVPAPPAFVHEFAVVLGQASTMILPQVHLRKPCYDFSFL